MKKIIFIALSAVLAVTAIFAQEEETAQEESAVTAETSEKRQTTSALNFPCQSPSTKLTAKKLTSGAFRSI